MTLVSPKVASTANGDSLPDPRHVRGNAVVYFGRAEDHYAEWPAPTCIIADGPYGVDGFPGDQPTPATLAEWHEPHILAWSERSTPSTTLWFWKTVRGCRLRTGSFVTTIKTESICEQSKLVRSSFGLELIPTMRLDDYSPAVGL